MGAARTERARQTYFRPLLKPAFYASPVVFGAVALKAACMASDAPVLAVSSLAVVMFVYVASSALMIRALENAGPN
jgi:hypothetical protein